MEIINVLNTKMSDFYKSWEFEDSEDHLINLNGELDTTQEIKSNIQKFSKMTEEIESIINDSVNYESIKENWDSINLTLLEMLVSTFEIEIENFISKVNQDSDIREEIKEFFGSKK